MNFLKTQKFKFHTFLIIVLVAGCCFICYIISNFNIFTEIWADYEEMIVVSIIAFISLVLILFSLWSHIMKRISRRGSSRLPGSSRPVIFWPRFKK